MSQTPFTPWYEWSLSKSIAFVVGIVGGVAGLLSVLPLLFAPHGDLQATYRHTRFVLPTYLLQPYQRDTAITRRDAACAAT